MKKENAAWSSILYVGEVSGGPENKTKTQNKGESVTPRSGLGRYGGGAGLGANPAPILPLYGAMKQILCDLGIGSSVIKPGFIDGEKTGSLRARTGFKECLVT